MVKYGLEYHSKLYYRLVSNASLRRLRMHNIIDNVIVPIMFVAVILCIVVFMFMV